MSEVPLYGAPQHGDVALDERAERLVRLALLLGPRLVVSLGAALNY